MVDPDLARRFARAVQALSDASQDLSHRFSRSHALAPADVRALTILAVADAPMSTGELADRVQLSSGAATRLVDRLVASGHAERVDDPADRRRVLVTHTDEAARVAGAWFGPLAERLRVRLEGLTDDQARVVVDVVEGLVDDLRQTGEST